jgi:predicted RNA-binding Zn ribbon-like protein
VDRAVGRWTADGDEFRFRAQRWSLDLCSTLLWRHVGPVELLRRPDDLSHWLVAAQLCTELVEVSQAQLGEARTLREAMYRLFGQRLGGASLGAADLASVNAAAARAGRYPQLTVAGRVAWWAREPVSAALAAVAADGIDLLAGPLAERVRECAAPDCAFLFVDTSRPGTRRWCAQDRCGNREHVRQHRARRTEQPGRPRRSERRTERHQGPG